tara:strand:+ start:255 stop:1433 length:1179 start_codon:yes stop_codon:yes gene_type:complete
VANFILWGVTPSPFQLKMQALLDYAGHRWQRWPDQASRSQALGMALRLSRARKRQEIERYPARVPGEDEYPAVPYYSEDGRHFSYDSTGLALYLDQHPQRHERSLLPAGDPPLGFICRLIDEAFDEFGLYMVHHNRWVTSARTNVMGETTARELRNLLPPLIPRLVARRMPRRQVRRCPYLFSVAPAGFDAAVSRSLTPPSKEGFPATHALLDAAWRQYLAGMETLLQNQPYLLGDRFTLADASAYGQLSMNLVDGRAADLLRDIAPVTYDWLCAIRDGRHIGSTGGLKLDEQLRPLLQAIADTFIPLMQQNSAAYHTARAGGETLFNEAAFNAGKALYTGEIQGHPFRSVAKSFQAVVWRELCAGWARLERHDKDQLESRYGLDGAAFSRG